MEKKRGKRRNQPTKTKQTPPPKKKSEKNKKNNKQIIFKEKKSFLDKRCCSWEMLNTSGNVLCEVVLVFACMFYHVDYYRITVTAYDYEYRKRTTERRCHAWWAECLAVCLLKEYVYIGGWVIVEVVRKGVVAGRCWSICWTHLQTFSVSTVVGEKASDVEQSWGASAELPGRHAPPRWTGRGQLKEGIMFLVSWRVYSLCLFLRSVHGNGCVRECLQNAILVRRLDCGERCLGPDPQCPR